MTSILEGQSLKIKPFATKTKVIGVTRYGKSIYLHYKIFFDCIYKSFHYVPRAHCIMFRFEFIHLFLEGEY